MAPLLQVWAKRSAGFNKTRSISPRPAVTTFASCPPPLAVSPHPPSRSPSPPPPVFCASSLSPAPAQGWQAGLSPLSRWTGSHPSAFQEHHPVCSQSKLAPYKTHPPELHPSTRTCCEFWGSPTSHTALFRIAKASWRYFWGLSAVHAKKHPFQPGRRTPDPTSSPICSACTC